MGSYAGGSRGLKKTSRSAFRAQIPHPALRDEIDAFKRQFEIESAALVLNSHLDPENQLAELVADSDPVSAAESALGLLTSPIGKSSDSVQNQGQE